MSSKLPSIVSASQSVHICILFCQLGYREVWNHSPEPADSPAVLITYCLRRMKDCLEICCRVLIFFLCVINSWQGTRRQTLVDRMEKEGQGSLMQKSSWSIEIVCLWVSVQGPVSRPDTGNQRDTWRSHELINQSVISMEMKSKSNFSLQVCILLQHCGACCGTK